MARNRWKKAGNISLECICVANMGAGISNSGTPFDPAMTKSGRNHTRQKKLEIKTPLEHSPTPAHRNYIARLFVGVCLPRRQLFYKSVSNLLRTSLITRSSTHNTFDKCANRPRLNTFRSPELVHGPAYRYVASILRLTLLPEHATPSAYHDHPSKRQWHIYTSQFPTLGETVQLFREKVRPFHSQPYINERTIFQARLPLPATKASAVFVNPVRLFQGLLTSVITA